MFQLNLTFLEFWSFVVGVSSMGQKLAESLFSKFFYKKTKM